jgi:CRP-like cAMP-binding protein
MAMAVPDATLAQPPFLQGLTAHQLAQIAPCASDAHFNGGTFIFREGEEATRFFLLTHGVVALEIHVPGRGSHTIATVHAGEALGWSWLVPPYRWHLDARALEPSAAIAFEARCLRAACDADHDVGYEVVTRCATIIVQRLQATRLQLLDVYGVHVPDGGA